MQYYKAFQGLGPISLSINHIHNILLEFLPLSVAACPAVTGTTSLFGNEDIFRIVKVCILTLLYSIDDLNKKLFTLGSRSMRRDRGM
jgi:hypothetical protein